MAHSITFIRYNTALKADLALEKSYFPSLYGSAKRTRTRIGILDRLQLLISKSGSDGGGNPLIKNLDFRIRRVPATTLVPFGDEWGGGGGEARHKYSIISDKLWLICKK